MQFTIDKSKTTSGGVALLPPENKNRVADTVVELLKRASVEIVFGIPGGTVGPIYDALLDEPSIEVITTTHESNAMFAAAGYALSTGQLAAVLVTSGPGLLNAINGIASAYCDQAPVLIIAGEVAVAQYGKGALQDGGPRGIDILSLTRPITKWSFQLQNPESVGPQIEHATTLAMSGRRGPVLASLPVDLLRTPMKKQCTYLRAPEPQHTPPLNLLAISSLLRKGERNVVLAGSGTRTGQAPAKLIEFAEKTNTPIMTTPKAKGVFPENHPLSLGVFGLAGHPSSTDYLQGGIDVLLAVGTSLNETATNGWSSLLQPKVAFVQVDIDASRIARSYHVDHAVITSADHFLGQLTDSVPTSTETKSFGVRRRAAEAVTEDSVPKKLLASRALWELQKVLPKDTIFTTDSGTNHAFATHYLEINYSDGYISMLGLASMGTALGTAFGAQIGKSNRTVAAIMGDGGFAMCASELSSIAKAQLPIIVFVLNNRGFGMVESGQNALFGRTHCFASGPFDVCGIAQACGANSLQVTKPSDILQFPFTDYLTNAPFAPLVIDVQICADELAPLESRLGQLGPKVPSVN